jgi:hypothetical protein
LRYFERLRFSKYPYTTSRHRTYRRHILTYADVLYYEPLEKGVVAAATFAIHTIVVGTVFGS